MIEPAKAYARPEHLPARNYIHPTKYGVSFSLKQCRHFGLDPQSVLDWLLAQGWRRFRLMSYWDEHEKTHGTYDFAALDTQIEQITEAGGIISLCLGVKQPRWPEYHWPDWAWRAEKPARDEALLAYVGKVVETYKNNPAIVSWQLENEALLQGFGEKVEIDRTRLRNEYKLIKLLDPKRPIIMTTSNGWGIPARQPRPDGVGLSYYAVMYKNGAYRRTIQKPWLHRLRRSIIRIILGKPVFIHELQCEPWGPKPIWKMNQDEQDESMGPRQIRRNIAAAQTIKAYPVDLWGGEWWYWRSRISHDPLPYDTVRAAVSTPDQ
jgi:hypothetical protein